MSAATTYRRAASPRPPALTPPALQELAEHEAYTHEREAVERKSVLRGLILLATLAVVFSLLRAGADRVFYASWWRQW